MKEHALGFTLIELMITLLIVAILAGIAIPSYSNYILRANRTDATSALLKVASAQEKFFLQNNTYASNALLATAPPAGLGITGTDQQLYTLAVIAPFDPDEGCALTECWAVQATPQSGKRQADDADCQYFYIDSSGRKRSGANKAAAEADTTPGPCWRR